MPISLGINIQSLTAQRALSNATSAVTRSLERLSSGQRINHVSDDAAGLAIAEHLESKQIIYRQGVRNLNDGTSLITIASNAIDELNTIVSRLKELASQASNGSYTSDQRIALDDEAQALADEYDRIASNTTFNGQKLFIEVNQVMLQAHDGPHGSIQGELGGEFGGTTTDEIVGTGTFGAATSYGVGGAFNGFTKVRLADLNGDNKLDLINAESGRAKVWMGVGDGTFGPATTYLSNNSADAMELGDLNGDNKLDLVTVGDSGGVGRISVRLGVGDGTFGAATSYTMASGGLEAVALADFNGDGKLDAVTGGSLGILSIRLGVGDGTFGASTSYDSGNENLTDIAVADLNGDGKRDLVFSGRDSDGRALVRLGVGDGTFGASTSYLMHANFAYGVSLADLNGDSKIDLVTAGSSGASVGYAAVRLGQGDGTFGAATTYIMDAFVSYDVELGDLNGDGKLDIVTAGVGSGGRATLRLGAGDGTFGAATSYLMEANTSAALALGDANADGALDVVTGGYDGAAAGYATIRLGITTTTSGSAYTGLPPFSLLTVAEAEEAFTLFEDVADDLTVRSGIVGAFQSRVSFATSVVQAFADNFGVAASRITDIDVAHEVALLVSAQIRQQAASAILAQANQQPALALQLLQA